MAANLNYPDGLEASHAAPRGGLHSHASLVSIFVLGTLMALALSGLLAGGRTTPWAVDVPAARIVVQTPERLRNGEFFETRLSIVARTDIADATIAVPSSLWRDMTVNTMIPAPGKEEFKDGAFRFRYGALRAGDTLDVKIDGQINPPLTLGTTGEIALYDGDRRLGAVPLSIGVLP